MGKQTPSTIKLVIALIIAILSVSTSAILVKLTTAPPAVIAMYRLLFTVIIMTPLLPFRKSISFKSLTKKDLILCMASGVFLAAHFILWFKSLDYTSVASSVVLVTLQPLFAFVGTALFFKEKLNFAAISGGIIAIIGSIVISWGDFQIGGMAFYGDVLALLGCFMVTAYLLLGQNARKKIPLFPYTYLVYGVATLVLIGYVGLLGLSFSPYPSSDWLYFILLAVFPTLLGHSIINWSVKWVSVSVISMSILGEPIGAAILAYYILGEQIIVPQIIGGSIILIGLLIFLKKY